MRIMRLIRRTMNLAALLIPISGVALAACMQEETPVEANVPLVEVVLSDFTNFPEFGWAVTAFPPSVTEGQVVLNVKNINTASTQDDMPDIGHTLSVIKSDLPPDKLPLRAAGRGIEISQVDVWSAAPVIDSGNEVFLNLNLVAGNYILVCNIVPDSTDSVSHYEQGSYTGFTVREKR